VHTSDSSISYTRGAENCDHETFRGHISHLLLAGSLDSGLRPAPLKPAL